MPKIAFDKLEVGMKLTKPVENSSGIAFLGENVELTVELIDKIRAWALVVSDNGHKPILNPSFH